MDNTSRTPIADSSSNRKHGGGTSGTTDKDGVYLWEGYPRVASAPSQVSFKIITKWIVSLNLMHHMV